MQSDMAKAFPDRAMAIVDKCREKEEFGKRGFDS